MACSKSDDKSSSVNQSAGKQFPKGDVSKVMTKDEYGMDVNACFEADKYAYYIVIVASRNPSYRSAVERNFKMPLNKVEKLYDDIRQSHLNVGLITDTQVAGIKLMEGSIIGEANVKVQLNKFSEYMDDIGAKQMKYSEICLAYVKTL